MSTIPTAPVDLAIVIVNYNTSGLLRDCLKSVFASTGELDLAVCVVDNASPDDSVAMVRAEFPQVHLIANPDNRGYPAANNQGLRYFGFGTHSAERPERVDDATEMTAGGQSKDALLPRFALVLNPETVLPPAALAQMDAFMVAHPQAGISGPKLVRLDGTLDKACRRSFPTPETSLWHLGGLVLILQTSRRLAR